MKRIALQVLCVSVVYVMHEFCVCMLCLNSEDCVCILRVYVVWVLCECCVYAVCVRAACECCVLVLCMRMGQRMGLPRPPTPTQYFQHAHLM